LTAIQCTQGVKWPEVKALNLRLSSAEVRNIGSYIFIPLYIFVMSFIKIKKKLSLFRPSRHIGGEEA
jgi:hypothetical protein